MYPKTASQRLLTVNEIKMQCIDNNLMDDLATKILFRMLDKYHEKGETYVNKELRLVGRYDRERKYVINLFNDTHQRDVVLIRAIEFNGTAEQC